MQLNATGSVLAGNLPFASGTVSSVCCLLLLANCGDHPTVPAVDLTATEPAVRNEIHQRREQVLKHPRDADHWGRYGLALDAHGYALEAQSVYRTAADLDDTEVRWPYYLAALLEVSEPQSAVDWYLRAIELKPNYAPAHIRLAQSLQQLDRTEQAERHFRRAAELEPHNAFGHLGLGQLALQRGDIAEALTKLQTAAEATPLMNATLAALAQAHHRNGDAERAKSLAARARDLPRKTYQSDPLLAEIRDTAVDRAGLMSRAVTYRDVGQMERALRLAQRAASNAPDHAGAALLVADIYERLERYSDAQQWAQRASEAGEPQGLHELRARIFYQQGDLQRAHQAAQRAVAADPLSADGNMVLGRVLLEQQETAEALEHLRNAVTARPQDSDWRLVLIDALNAAGRHQDAAAETTALQVSGGMDAAAWFGLGKSHLMASRFSQAVAAFEQVLALEQNDDAVTGLVQSLLQSRGPGAAQRRLEQRVSSHPQDVVAVLLLTDFLFAHGRAPEALEMLSALSRRAPTRADVWLQLGHVQLGIGRHQDAELAFSRAFEHAKDGELRALANQGLAQARNS